MEPLEYVPGFFAHECCFKFFVFVLLIYYLADELIRLVKSYFAKKSDYSCADCKAWDCPGKLCYRSWVKSHSDIIDYYREKLERKAAADEQSDE